MMTMKEVCEYITTQRKANAIRRNNVVAIDGNCSGVTEKQYKSIKTKAKGAGSRGRKHSHTALWNHYNEPVKQFTNQIRYLIDNIIESKIYKHEYYKIPKV